MYSQILFRPLYNVSLIFRTNQEKMLLSSFLGLQNSRIFLFLQKLHILAAVTGKDITANYFLLV